MKITHCDGCDVVIVGEPRKFNISYRLAIGPELDFCNECYNRLLMTAVEELRRIKEENKKS